MYKTYNKDEVYFMRNMVTGVIIKIGSRIDLIKSVSEMISVQDGLPYWRRNEKWDEKRFRQTLYQYGCKTDNVFTKQNLTGKDVYYTRKTETKVIYDNPEEPKKSRNSYTYIHTEHVQPHMFYTEAGAVFDIRFILNEVKDYLISGRLNSGIRGIRRKQFNRQSRHVTYGAPRRFRLRERKSKISCEEQGVKYRNKSLPYGKIDRWDGYTESRRSSGWKDKQYKSQWEHNLINKKAEFQSPNRMFGRNTELNIELQILEELALLKELGIEECA